MRSFLVRWLVCPLHKSHWTGLNRNLARKYYLPVMVAGGIIALFEVMMMVVTAARPGGIFHQPWRAAFFFLYVFLLCATLACLAVGLSVRKTLADKPRVFLNTCLVYAFAICGWCSVLTALTHRTTPDLSVFLYTVLGVAILLPMRPWHSIAVFLFNEALFLVLMFRYIGPSVDPYASTVNSAITTLLGILISITLYRGHVRDYRSRDTIERQNAEINRINEQLSNLVLIDDLTHAYNRRYMEEVLPDKLEAIREAGQPVTVLMFDLDHFKQYNDLYGHQAGDRCLVRFAQLVQDYMKEREGSFIRYGGEEFVLFLPGVGTRAGMQAADEIRTRLCEANITHSGSETGYITTSVGVRSSLVGEDSTAAQLISEADEALYIAKNSGRNRVKQFYVA